MVLFWTKVKTNNVYKKNVPRYWQVDGKVNEDEKKIKKKKKRGYPYLKIAKKKKNVPANAGYFIVTS